jgi:hypothetical protein
MSIETETETEREIEKLEVKGDGDRTEGGRKKKTVAWRKLDHMKIFTTPDVS